MKKKKKRKTELLEIKTTKAKKKNLEKMIGI